MHLTASLLGCLTLAAGLSTATAAQWVTYEPKPGKGAGKHIVFLSGDEEYRSEQGLPQMGKILSQRHGFKCTVLFSQDADGTINPNNSSNIPGMSQLDGADLVVNQFRFRELPDADMAHFDAYLNAGKPMMVLRTATHAFNYTKNKDSVYAKYHWQHHGGVWTGGFGGATVGETWTYHHGDHGKEGTRGIIDGKNRQHPILNGVKDDRSRIRIGSVSMDVGFMARTPLRRLLPLWKPDLITLAEQQWHPLHPRRGRMGASRRCLATLRRN